MKSQICFLTPRKLQPGFPLFVFLPGMDGTGQLLRTQTEGLEAAFDIRCLAIPPDDLNNWDVLTEKVVSLVQAEVGDHSSRTVYLCGESFGGCLAIATLLRAPELFTRAILVNPASSFHRRPWIQWGSHLTRLLPESVYQVASVALLPLLASFGQISAQDRQELLNAVQTVPQKTSIWRMSLLNQFHLEEAQLRQITLPILVIASAVDRLLPSLTEAQYLVQHLPQAQMHILKNSGHACLLEAEVNLLEIMQAHQFLEEPVKDKIYESMAR